MAESSGFDLRNSTWVEVNLDAIRYNVENIIKHARTPALIVVKSNGYGHGAVQVSSVAASAGAKMLGVTSVGEAFQLREGGISAPILILAPVRESDYLWLSKLRASVTEWRREQLEALSFEGLKVGHTIPIHLKVDVGMGRFGASPVDAPGLIEFASTLHGTFIEGISAHLSSSDIEDPAITLAQIDRFSRVIDLLRSRHICPPIVHCANSAAAFRFPQASFDMVRAGISVYGVNPSSTYPTPFELKPSLTWKASVMNIETHEPGDLIGYGGEYTCQERQVIATIGAGYADGFRRVPKNVNAALLQGHRVPVVGRLCMQQCMLAVPGAVAGSLRLNDEVVLLGRQEDQQISATELADRWGTNEWDVFCGINSCIKRIYTQT